MSDIREVTNPSDKITIDYTDKDAARIAVLLIGSGYYGISGEDGMPVFLLGGGTAWVREQYGMTPGALLDSVPLQRIIAALESIKLVNERSSMNDIAGQAHSMAKRMRDKLEVKS